MNYQKLENMVVPAALPLDFLARSSGPVPPLPPPPPGPPSSREPL
jgi:hypothetical protein